MTAGSQAYNSIIASSTGEYQSIHDLVVKNGVIEMPKYIDSSLFSFVAKTIVGQQLSNKAANTIWSRIEAIASSFDTDIYGVFCDIYYDHVKSCGVSKNKMKSILCFKDTLISEPDFEITLKLSTYNEVLKKLTAIWGIGIWTADMVAIFYLQLPDVYPINDVAIANGIKRLCGESVDVKEIALVYTPFQSHLCLHIWRGIDDGYL